MDSKKCSQCNAVKALAMFSFWKAKGKYRSHCKVCQVARSSEWKKKNPEKKRAQAKREYDRLKADPEAFKKYLARLTAWKKANPRRQRVTNRKQRLRFLYGMTPESYATMLLEQDHRCAICRTSNPGYKHGRFVVDHDHMTGNVRGLLCHRCNVLLGIALDEQDRLRNAASYLDRAQSNRPVQAD